VRIAQVVHRSCGVASVQPQHMHAANKAIDGIVEKAPGRETFRGDLLFGGRLLAI
jgi:hypothetical protein